MSSSKLHLVHRNLRTKRSKTPDEPPPAAPGRLPRAARKTEPEDTDPRLSTNPLAHPIGILLRMPDLAVSPALLELIDVMSSPIHLIENGPVGNLREMVAPRPSLAMAA